ncbi:hypothetical protein P0D75_37225 [Paraburkholderia sediminicola]|uniref:hypothetical protein n=1 Tax=Paraburkholderia sediminicola TaxID=458836 RepID=UPI0038BC3ED3
MSAVNIHGYVVVPDLTLYGVNNVEIDSNGTSTDVAFQLTSEQGRIVAQLGGNVRVQEGESALVIDSHSYCIPRRYRLVWAWLTAVDKQFFPLLMDIKINAGNLEDNSSLFVNFWSAAPD